MRSRWLCAYEYKTYSKDVLNSAVTDIAQTEEVGK